MNNLNPNNIPALPRRELGKMINSNPIVVRVREKGSRKITREFIVSNELVFQANNGTYRLINTVENFIHAILTQ